MKRIVLAALATLAILSTGCKKYEQPELGARKVDIIKVGKYQFKDLNKNGKLDVYEDWRKPMDKRIADLVSHVRERAYEGKSVKIDNLGIFRVSMKSKGVEDPKDFNAASDITSKWQVQPTGAVVGKSIDVTRAAGAVLTWEELGDYSSPRNTEGGGE